MAATISPRPIRYDASSEASTPKPSDPRKRPKPLLGPRYWLISDSSQAMTKIVSSSGSAAMRPVRNMRPILLIGFLRRSAGNLLLRE